MRRLVESLLPTLWGTFRIFAYGKSETDTHPQVVMISEHLDTNKPVLLRIHSECMTGDLFGSLRCDCGEQLHEALRRIAKEGGLVIYLRQEGRGIGLTNKLKAYNLQDQGLNTAEANTHLGFEVDARSYQMAIDILQDLGISQVRLLTNNPEKLSALESSPIEVVGREPLVISPKEENEAYLETKKKLMGHLF